MAPPPQIPPPLNGNLAEIEERLSEAARVALFLDFDGTIAPIAPKPALARLEAGVRETLHALNLRKDFAVAVISGRALEDVRSRTGLPSLIYAGCHGLEIRGPGIAFLHPEAARRRPALRRLAQQLVHHLGQVSGVEVENKGLAVAVHYRRAASSARVRVLESVRSALRRTGPCFQLRSGRKIYEILPRTGWNKGSAIRWILHRMGNADSLPIYLGDDVTDEDAFAALPEGVTVRVGGATGTLAAYRLAGPGEVAEFLAWLGARRHERAKSGCRDLGLDRSPTGVQ